MADEWIDRCGNYMHRSITSRRKGVLTPATTGVNLENMPSEISQTQKNRNCVIPLICDSSNDRFLEAENRPKVTRARGGEKGEL